MVQLTDNHNTVQPFYLGKTSSLDHVFHEVLISILLRLGSFEIDSVNALCVTYVGKVLDPFRCTVSKTICSISTHNEM